MSSEKYLKALAYELRQRKHNEEMVGCALREVSSHLAESGESGEAAFGQPRDYAASFPVGSAVSTGARVGHAAAGLLILLLGGYLILRLGVGFSLGFPGTLTYFASVAVVTITLVLTGAALDRRVPDLG